MSDADPVDAPRDVWDRWVDLAVYAPVGLAVSIKEDLPRFVRQGRQAVENRVRLARWIGQMAVQQGQRELTKLVEERRRVAEEAAPEEPAVVIMDVREVSDEPVRSVEPTATHDSSGDSSGDSPGNSSGDSSGDSSDDSSDDLPGPEAADLPIEGYESLAALHVVQRLAGLSAAELESVRRFETAHRARRTILAKVAQLQGD